MYWRLRSSTVELFALKIGLEYAVEGNWGSFLIKSDCIEVIHQISGNGWCGG